jgi:hypothetical protein
MAGPGGTRPGAGRKRKSDKHAGQIAKAEKRIADRLPDIVDRLLELADGIQVQTVDEETGGINIYAKPPDRQAAEYLLNRIMGKPTERIEQHQTFEPINWDRVPAEIRDAFIDGKIGIDDVQRLANN